MLSSTRIIQYGISTKKNRKLDEQISANQHLSLILMGLGRCKEALAFSQHAAEFDPTDEEHTTTAFRMGQCLVELGRWEEAYMQFKTLYNATLEFEKSTREVQLPSGTRVLNKTM